MKGCKLATTGAIYSKDGWIFCPRDKINRDDTHNACSQIMGFNLWKFSKTRSIKFFLYSSTHFEEK